MIIVETKKKPSFIRIPKIFNDPENRIFEVIVIPGHGRITLFEGNEYDTIDIFTEAVIVNRVKSLLNIDQEHE